MKKRVLSLLLVLMMSLVPTMAFADGVGVAVDKIDFPDDAFRAYVSENCDTDGNGYLSDEEISNAISINVGWRDIASLEGVGYFTELQSLDCSYSQLTELPQLPSGLTGLFCDGNQLTELPALPSGLTGLGCGWNQLTEIKLNPSAEYTHINVSYNRLSDKEAVTGQYIDWDEQNFIFGEQNHEHVTELRNDVAPTCTDSGYTGDEVCTICGEVTSQGEVIEATGHHFKGNTCPDCGATRSTADTIRAFFQDSFNNFKSFFDKLFGK